MKYYSALVALLFALIALPSQGKEAGPVIESATAAECNGLRVATGPKGKGYSVTFEDMRNFCGSEVELCERRTDGAIDNLTDLSLKNADIGMTSVFVYQTMKDGDPNIARLQQVMALNHNFIHPLINARGWPATVNTGKAWYTMGLGKDRSEVQLQPPIQKMSELKGKVVGMVGSGKLTIRRLNDILQMNMQLVDMKNDSEAVESLKAGRIQGAITVAGWPNGVIQQLTAEDGVQMVPFDLIASDPFIVGKVNYKSIGQYNINALGDPNILVARPFEGEKAALVAKLKSCLVAKLKVLKDNGRSSAWNEITDTDKAFKDISQFSYGAPKKR